MIFSHYTETCVVLLDYPKIGEDDIIEDDAKKATRTLLHANIDVHSRILIDEFKLISYIPNPIPIYPL